MIKQDYFLLQGNRTIDDSLGNFIRVNLWIFRRYARVKERQKFRIFCRDNFKLRFVQSRSLFRFINDIFRDVSALTMGLGGLPPLRRLGLIHSIANLPADPILAYIVARYSLENITCRIANPAWQ